MVQSEISPETFKLIFSFEKKPTVDTLKKIIEGYRKDNLPINTKYDGFITILHIKQPWKTMKYILDNGGNPNVEGYYGIKPIHLQEDYQTIKTLVERGAQPNPIDDNNFNPLFWQKDVESTLYLLKYNDVYTSRIIPISKLKYTRSPYLRMLVEGGYDPYSEYNIAVSPLFLQRNVESFRILMNISYLAGIEDNFYDVAYETILFKPCITPKFINKCSTIFTRSHHKFYINHQNVLGNTALHVQHSPENTIALLKNGADWNIKNNNGLDPIEYHFDRNNIIIYDIIREYSSAKIIQRCWRKFWFDKNYIPPKYFKIKKEFLYDFIHLSPSECHTFPGGIEYQKAYQDFMNLIS